MNTFPAPKDELDKLITTTGDRIAFLFEQLMKGNWVDDNGHNVKMNKAMIDLKGTLVDLGEFRDKYLGYEEFKLGDQP